MVASQKWFVACGQTSPWRRLLPPAIPAKSLPAAASVLRGYDFYYPTLTTWFFNMHMINTKLYSTTTQFIVFLGLGSSLFRLTRVVRHQVSSLYSRLIYFTGIRWHWTCWSWPFPSHSLDTATMHYKWRIIGRLWTPQPSTLRIGCWTGIQVRNCIRW